MFLRTTIQSNPSTQISRPMETDNVRHVTIGDEFCVGVVLVNRPHCRNISYISIRIICMLGRTDRFVGKQEYIFISCCDNFTASDQGPSSGSSSLLPALFLYFSRSAGCGLFLNLAARVVECCSPPH